MEGPWLNIPSISETNVLGTKWCDIPADHPLVLGQFSETVTPSNQKDVVEEVGKRKAFTAGDTEKRETKATGARTRSKSASRKCGRARKWYSTASGPSSAEGSETVE